MIESNSFGPSFSDFYAARRCVTSFFEDPSVSPLPSATLLPQFNRGYFHYSRQAFNMAQFLVSELQFDDSVFHTALHYWHRFVAVHGLHALSEVLLIASSVFLAAKVSHYKFSAKQLVILAFDINGGNTEHGRKSSSLSSSFVACQKDVEEEVELWRRALLDTELLLCDTLQFQFHVPNPIRQMEDVLALAAKKEGFFYSSSFVKGKEEEQEEEYRRYNPPCESGIALLSQLIARVKRLHIYLLITPLPTCVTVEELSLAILLIVIRYGLCCSPTKALYSSIPPSWNDDGNVTTTTSLVDRGSRFDRFAARVGEMACARFGEGGCRGTERNEARQERGSNENEGLQQGHLSPPLIPEKFVEGVLGVVIETFSLMKKSTDIPALDELVASHSEKKLPKPS